MRSSGCRVQALSPASAKDAPISFRNSRRPVPASRMPAAWRGNSCSRNSRNSSLPASSSRLRHSSRPRCEASRRRTAPMSRGGEGRTGSTSLLAVTGVAVDARVDVVGLHQLEAQRPLIVRRRPLHVEYVLARPHLVLGMAMAVEAPFHLQGHGLIELIHLVDVAVARRAADALVHVHAVVEVDKVGQIVHPDPADRAVVAPARAHWLEVRALRPDLRVAVHARLRRGDAGERRDVDTRVAVATVDAELAGVMRVAELDGLLPVDTLAGDVPAAVDGGQQPERSGDEEGGAEDADPRESVRAALENLRHARLPESSGLEAAFNGAAPEFTFPDG